MFRWAQRILRSAPSSQALLAKTFILVLSYDFSFLFCFEMRGWAASWKEALFVVQLGAGTLTELCDVT